MSKGCYNTKKENTPNENTDPVQESLKQMRLKKALEDSYGKK